MDPQRKDYLNKVDFKKAQKNISQLLFPYAGNYTVMGTSYLGLEPGDIVFFNYLKTSRGMVRKSSMVNRLGIVVSSDRTGGAGTFRSTRQNLLLNLFILDGLTNSFFDVVVNTLYLKRVKCDYRQHPRKLNAFLKKQNFRTLDTKFIGAVNKVIINIEKFKAEKAKEEEA